MSKTANEFPEMPNVENPIIINMDKNMTLKNGIMRMVK